MALQLSGYLPGEDRDGLSRFAEALVEKFEAAYADGDTDPVQVVVVGVLTAETVKHHRDPEEKPPTVAVRFAAVEGADGKRADQLRWVLGALRSDRLGQPALDGFDEAVAAMLEGRDDLPPPPPDIIDSRGGSNTGEDSRQPPLDED
jgi:hypothetical protein